MVAYECVRDRILSEAVADPETGCWLWCGAVNNSGYPSFSAGRKGKVATAGRIILRIVDEPRTVVACHTCDNRRCVRPEHLYVGTQKQNMQDCVSRGRLSPERGVKTRDQHPRTKIKVADIPSIIERKKRGEPWNKIGETYGASGTAARLATRQWEAGKYA